MHYHADGGGNVAALVDANHALLAQYRYDPYGRQTWSTGTLKDANTYRFSSKEFVPNLGFYYYGFRFHDPQTQRWVNRDPILEAGGVNLYGFVGNSPVDEIDPLGERGVRPPPAPPRNRYTQPNGQPLSQFNRPPNSVPRFHNPRKPRICYVIQLGEPPEDVIRNQAANSFFDAIRPLVDTAASQSNRNAPPDVGLFGTTRKNPSPPDPIFFRRKNDPPGFYPQGSTVITVP